MGPVKCYHFYYRCNCCFPETVDYLDLFLLYDITLEPLLLSQWNFEHLVKSCVSALHSVIGFGFVEH